MNHLLTTLTGYRGESPDVDPQFNILRLDLTRDTAHSINQLLFTRPDSLFLTLYMQMAYLIRRRAQRGKYQSSRPLDLYYGQLTTN